MKPIDDAPVAPEPVTRQGRRDLKDESDDEAYRAMLALVEEEMIVQAFGWGCGSPKPDGRKVHAEAIRRLRAK